MNIRISWVCVMKCMLPKIRPCSIISSKRAIGVESELMLTPWDEYPQLDDSDEGWTCHPPLRKIVSITHCQLNYSSSVLVERSAGASDSTCTLTCVCSTVNEHILYQNFHVLWRFIKFCRALKQVLYSAYNRCLYMFSLSLYMLFCNMVES